MEKLHEYLTALDRKERHALMREVFGNCVLQLSDEFLFNLSKRLSHPIPKDHYIFFDYHIDWIYAALYFFHNNLDYSDKDTLNISLQENPQLKFTQEDIDLLIYFEESEKHHFVLVEVKYDTSWRNKQLDSKYDRFSSIQKSHVAKNVIFHYMILSPTQPDLNRKNIWNWIEMKKSPSLFAISRCNKEHKPSAEGDHWMAVDRSPK